MSLIKVALNNKHNTFKDNDILFLKTALLKLANDPAFYGPLGEAIQNHDLDKIHSTYEDIFKNLKSNNQLMENEGRLLDRFSGSRTISEGPIILNSLNKILSKVTGKTVPNGNHIVMVDNAIDKLYNNLSKRHNLAPLTEELKGKIKKTVLIHEMLEREMMDGLPFWQNIAKRSKTFGNIGTAIGGAIGAVKANPQTEEEAKILEEKMQNMESGSKIENIKNKVKIKAEEAKNLFQKIKNNKLDTLKGTASGAWQGQNIGAYFSELGVHPRFSSHMGVEIPYLESNYLSKLDHPETTKFFNALRDFTGESEHFENAGMRYGKFNSEEILNKLRANNEPLFNKALKGLKNLIKRK